MNERLAKTALVAGVGLFMALVVLNNLTDYGSNFAFVRHVLAMDTTFPENRLRWRALTHPAVHHAFYAGIIAWETVSAALIARAALAMWRARASAAAFAAALPGAAVALTVNLLLWFLAFLTVGGEWFVMWQSGTWNGQDAAFRMFAIVALILLYIRLPEPPRAGAPPLSSSPEPT
jgi:predicted small integral membrane protein